MGLEVYDTQSSEDLEKEVLKESKEKIDEIYEEVNNNELSKESSQEKTEKKFTFRPISLDLWASTIENGEKWANGITTEVEFAWWSEKVGLYAYARKDWNEYAKWFNEWIELFLNENFHLWKSVDINGKQFYWWKWSGKIMQWLQISTDKQLGKVWLWGSLWWYAAYDIVPWAKNQVSWSVIPSVNVSVEQKNWKKWTWDAFLHIKGMQDFDYKKYWTYGEANIQTPNLLDPKTAWALCWWVFARYWWDIKEINLLCAWVWLKYSF